MFLIVFATYKVHFFQGFFQWQVEILASTLHRMHQICQQASTFHVRNH